MRPTPRQWWQLLAHRVKLLGLILVAVYTLGALAFWALPSIGPDGEPFHMSPLDALYMVAITGTTIGFGEFPVPFTAAQRGFMLVYAHLVVVSWLLFAGSVIATIQSQVFQRGFQAWWFRKRVARLREPYCVVVGYGQTGLGVVDYLTEYGISCVVIDKKQTRVDLLSSVRFKTHVFGRAGDGSIPNILLDAGIGRANCQAVVVLTDDYRSNLGVATAVRLLQPQVRLFVRSESDDITRNLLSFSTDHVLDPFRLYARKLALRLGKPLHFALIDQLQDPTQRVVEEPPGVAPGPWLMAGYGRFGRAIEEVFKRDNIPLHIMDPAVDDAPPQWVKGMGTEEPALRAAGLSDAVGIIAGSNHDPDNLSIWMTARKAHPGLYSIGRLNRPSSQPAFAAAEFDWVVHLPEVIAEELVSRLRTPLLHGFLIHLESQSQEWVEDLYARVLAVAGKDVDLETWDLRVTKTRAPRLVGAHATLKQVCGAHVVPLKIGRGEERLYLPAMDTVLQDDDEILFWGRAEARPRMLTQVGKAL